MILNGSFPLSLEATLIILYLELELLLIPEGANSLELNPSFWMDGNSQDQFRAERCSAFCCRFTAVDTSSPTSSSGQCTSTMFSFSTASKTASGGPLSTPLAASPTAPLKASTPVPAAGRSLMHIVGNNINSVLKVLGHSELHLASFFLGFPAAFTDAADLLICTP